jgi:hypothetical protein
MTWHWRPLAPGETDHETLWASVAAALAVMFVLWVALVEWPPVLCPLRALTGLPCPTCGATRALFAFTSGELRAALRWNPLVGVALGAAIPYVAYAGAVSLLRLPRLRLRVGAREARLARAAAVTAVLANWAFLIVDGR